MLDRTKSVDDLTVNPMKENCQKNSLYGWPMDMQTFEWSHAFFVGSIQLAYNTRAHSLVHFFLSNLINSIVS